MSLQVKDVMVTSIITIEAEDTVKNAAELMEKHDIGCLIVINYETQSASSLNETCSRKFYFNAETLARQR